MAITKKQDPKSLEKTEEVLGTQENVLEFEVEVEDTETPTKKEESLPVSEVMRMIDEINRKNEERMKKLEDKIKNTSKKVEDSTYIDDITDDYLEFPVIFFAYENSKFIHGDYRNGREVVAPDGKIKFETIIRQKRKDRSGGEQVISVSSAKIQSKRQVEFLRNHTHYGITFYEHIDSAKNVDAIWASKLIEANASLARLSDAQIIEKCKRDGVKISSNLTEMRKALLEKIAKEQLSLQQKSVKATFDSPTGMTMDDDGRVIY